MKIKKVRFKNGYKRFFDLTIDLGEEPRRLVALVGPNGCGKSSVLDGMLFHASAWAPIGQQGRRDFNYHSMNKLPSYDHNNVSIEFIDGNFQTVREMREQGGTAGTIFSFRSPYRYNSVLKVAESRALQEMRLNAYGASLASDLDEKMEQSYRRLNIKYQKYLHDTDCAPSTAKAKIIGDLNSSLRKCLDIELVSTGNIESGQGTLYFTKSDQQDPFEFNVLSSGEKEVVDILLDIYLRQDDFTDSVFLFDEPELHINTAIQKNMLIEMDRLIGKDCQIWITTHSIGFLRALQSEFKDQCQIIQFEQGKRWATEPYILKSVHPSRATWKSLFHTALDDLTELISPRVLIYCEGRDRPGAKGAERGLDANVLNNVFSSKYQDSLFVSSGGNTELDQRSEIALALLTKVFSDIQILVLKDRDISSGRTNTQADRKLYLSNNPSNHRVLERWEIENYLFDKEVLEKYCAMNGLTFDGSEYDKFVTDIVNQNVKDETPRFRNFCGIVTNVNAEQFKLNLSRVISPDMTVFAELERCIFDGA